jgi:hypothetical protein
MSIRRRRSVQNCSQLGYFAEEPGVKASSQGFTLADLVRGRGLFAPAGIAGARLRSTSTHGHPRIRCTQTAMPTAITKNSGSASAKPTAFASISAPAFPPWARSLTAHIPITFRCLRSVRAYAVRPVRQCRCHGGPELDRAAGQPARDTAMSLIAEQRRALAILRSSKNGVDPRSENHARGDPGLGGCVGWGPGIRPDGWCVPPQGYID